MTPLQKGNRHGERPFPAPLENGTKHAKQHFPAPLENGTKHAKQHFPAGPAPLENGTKHAKQHFPTGFTLLEIVMALVILTVGMLGLLSLFPVGFDAQKQACEVVDATILTQTKIAELRLLKYNNLTEGAGHSAYTNPYYEYELDITKDTKYELKYISVKTYWPADKGGPGDRSKQKSIELKTAVAKYD